MHFCEQHPIPARPHPIPKTSTQSLIKSRTATLNAHHFALYPILIPMVRNTHNLRHLLSLYTRTARKPDVRKHSLIPRIIGRAEHKHTLSSEEEKAKMAAPVQIEVWNPNGKYRVVSTKSMPGTRWIDLLVQQDCRVEVSKALSFNFFLLLLLYYYPLSLSLIQLISRVFIAQICTQKKTILSVEDILAVIGDKCDGVIGQVNFTS